MSIKTKTLAKSLHTVTAIQRVARLIQSGSAVENNTAVEQALTALGYDGALDPYGLANAALIAMDREDAR